MSRPPFGAWAWWLLVGALVGVGVVSILTIGIFVLALAGLLAAVGVSVPSLRNESALAATGGLAAPALYLAWINRSGPGDVCSGDTCTEQYSPWPFVAFAVVFVVLPFVLARVTRRPNQP